MQQSVPKGWNAVSVAQHLPSASLPGFSQPIPSLPKYQCVFPLFEAPWATGWLGYDFGLLEFPRRCVQGSQQPLWIPTIPRNGRIHGLRVRLESLSDCASIVRVMIEASEVSPKCIVHAHLLRVAY